MVAASYLSEVVHVYVRAIATREENSLKY